MKKKKTYSTYNYVSSAPFWMFVVPVVLRLVVVMAFFLVFVVCLVFWCLVVMKWKRIKYT
jgi:hypothetical protein